MSNFSKVLLGGLSPTSTHSQSSQSIPNNNNHHNTGSRVTNSNSAPQANKFSSTPVQEYPKDPKKNDLLTDEDRQRIANVLKWYVGKGVASHLEQVALNPALGSSSNAIYMDVLNGLRGITVLFIKLSNGFYNYSTKDVDVPALHLTVSTVQSVVFQFEGYLKFLVDDKGTLVVCAFGPTPYSHGDDCVRGVFAAIKIRDILQKNSSIHSYIGVTTGRAFCGWVGSSERREYTIVGDVVNLSARLMAAAEKLKVGILCDRSTYNQTKKQFEFKQLSPITVKGKSEPVDIYIPVKNLKDRSGKSSRIGVKNKITPLGSSPASLPLNSLNTNARKMSISSSAANSPKSPSNPRANINLSSTNLVQNANSNNRTTNITQMIGRQREKQAIHLLLNSLRTKKGGAFVVEGDAGMGKTMLLNFAFEKAKEQGFRSVAGQCEALEQTPLLIWKAIFYQLFDLEESRQEQSTNSPRDRSTLHVYEIICRRLKIDDEISDGNNNSYRIMFLLPLLNNIFRVKFPEGTTRLIEDGEWRNMMTLELLMNLFKSLIADYTGTVVILDNCQWMDSISFSFTLAVAKAQLPVILFVGLRSTSEAHSFYALPSGKFIKLVQMQPEEIRLLIEEKLKVSTIPETVYNFLITKSQGNPLLCEELLAQLRNLGAIEIVDDTCNLVKDLSELHLSNSIQGLITCRIDALPPGPLLVLQVASVIGREFDFETVKAVFPITIDHSSLTSDLDELVRQDMITCSINILGGEDEESQENQDKRISQHRYYNYNVKNIVIFEICYNTMSFSMRLQLHRHLAQWYEEKIKDVKGPDLSVITILTHHWVKIAEHREADTESLLKAIKYLAAVASQGYEALCHVEALRSLQKAETFLARIPPDQSCPQATEIAFMKRLLANDGSTIRRGTVYRNRARANQASSVGSPPNHASPPTSHITD